MHPDLDPSVHGFALDHGDVVGVGFVPRHTGHGPELPAAAEFFAAEVEADAATLQEVGELFPEDELVSRADLLVDA